MRLDTTTKIAGSLDRRGRLRTFVPEIDARAGGHCRLLLLRVGLATICSRSALAAVGHPDETRKEIEQPRRNPWIGE
jgi:hypothetical protein